jgi:hypothetical protein
MAWSWIEKYKKTKIPAGMAKEPALRGFFILIQRLPSWQYRVSTTIFHRLPNDIMVIPK